MEKDNKTPQQDEAMTKRDPVDEFDKDYSNVIDNARRTSFGMIMTIIDTLALDPKQLKAVKSLLARDIDYIMFNILDNQLREHLNRHFDHKREWSQAVQSLDRPIA